MGWQWSPYQHYPGMALPPPRTTEQDLIDNRMTEIYAEYADIVSTDDTLDRTRARLQALYCYAESHSFTGRDALEHLRQLLNDLHWELLDARQFALFYRFVFFLCREKAQKCITVNIAVDAWKLSLTGRFRLLDQWCQFVQSHHRHAISEDTWKQVLEFSRVVHEDLSNYDPEGAWPVLIDEFVEHMYRCSSCSCSEMCTCQQNTAAEGLSTSPHTTRSSSLSGMSASAGSKRRRRESTEEVALSRHLKRLLLEKEKRPSDPKY